MRTIIIYDANWQDSKPALPSPIMSTVPQDFESLASEHCVLLRHFGQVQTHCSRLVTAQAAEIKALRVQVMRLRAAVIVRDTRLAWAREDAAALRGGDRARSPPGRGALAGRMGMLWMRLRTLIRGRMQRNPFWRTSA